MRDNYDLDEIYRLLKTHELEMEQRSKMKNYKAKTVTLKVEEKAAKEEAVRKGHSRGKAMYVKSDSESSNTDDDSNFDEDSNSEEVKQLVALVVKSIENMGYRRFTKKGNFSKKGSTNFYI